MSPPASALVVVDMQRYYLDPGSTFHRYAEHRCEGAMAYIDDRCASTVVPAILRLVSFFRARSLPIAYFRLCGTQPDRSDLHRFFRSEHEKAASEGFDDLYPLASDPYSEILPELAPRPEDLVFLKTGFGGFNDDGVAERLRSLGVSTLFFSGLATSQCVDTSARGASDRGFAVVHVEDAEADYTPEMHRASLYASYGVCGGNLISSLDLEDSYAEIVATAT